MLELGRLRELGAIDGQPGSWLLRRDPTIGKLLGELLGEVPQVPLPAPRRRLVRADDHLLLELTLHDLAVEQVDGGPILRRRSAQAVLVAHFPPQSVAEEAFPDLSPTDVPSKLPSTALPARARHAGQSRLAVRMPVDVEVAPYTVDGVLDALAEWPLALVARSLGTGFLPPLDRLDRLADLVAEGFHERYRGAASALSTQVARRAAHAAVAARTPTDLIEAGAVLARDAVLAARRLGFEDEQAAGLRLHAELRFARAVLSQFGTAVPLVEILELLPALSFLFVPREPPPAATAIELPYRLVQSPSTTAAFSHARDAVTHDGRTELWHTRLGERVDGVVVDATEQPSLLAAIWSPDYPDGTSSVPGFTTSLTAQDRAEIVKLTADETGMLPGARRRYVPQPVRADRLMLTALGGWLDVAGVWEQRPANASGEPLSLVGWKHHAALGRDWFVETVRVGRLQPFGHRAVTIQQTERRFQDTPDGSGRVAVLRRKLFIEVREPLRRYPGDTQRDGGRDFPWRTVEILTHRTPSLIPPSGLAIPPAPETIESYWPRLASPTGAADFRFEVRATDLGGAVTRFSVPMRFVSDAVPYDTTAPITVKKVVQQYNGLDQQVSGRTTARMEAQPVQVAPAAARVDPAGAPDPGDVVFPLDQVRFGANLPTTTPAAGSPVLRFHPRVRTLHIISTSLQQLTGDDTPGEMAFADVYRLHGFSTTANRSELVLSATAGGGLTADFATRSSSDKAGGIVTPNFGVTGTSRAFGLVGGDLDLLAGGTFDPASFFPSAKIFGGVDLKDILAPIAVALAGAVVPKLRTTRTKEKIETVFEHRVEKVPNSVPLLRMNERGTSTLDIRAQTTAWFKVADPSVAPIGSGPGAAGGNPPGLKEPEVKAEAKLTWFKLNFFGCVVVSFDSFLFKVSAKDGVDADPKIASQNGVVFGGPLAFVDDLRRLLSGSKDGDGATPAGAGGGGGGAGIPGFKVTPIFKPEPTGLTVGTKLGVTKIPVGIFTMKNLMVSAALRLPFDGQPLTLQFGFAERSNPFQLTVSLFGGGGFVVLSLDTQHPVRELEAALEFGAFAELDFGVASGAIYVKGGIYIYFNAPEEQTTLKGYVEMGGEVQVLGILSVSITLHVSLGYYKVGKVAEARGQATLVIEIELLFFSASVNLTVERRFGGAEADPTFRDLIVTPSVWDEYAEAFA